MDKEMVKVQIKQINRDFDSILNCDNNEIFTKEDIESKFRGIRILIDLCESLALEEFDTEE